MFPVLFGFLLLQRVLELILSTSNRRWLMKRGGQESGQGHYPWIVGLHALFFLSLALEYRFLSNGWDALWPVWFTMFLGAQAVRVWVILSLGRYWTTRIIVVPGARRIVRGPYSYLRHPNYLVVAIEIIVVPVMCGAYMTAIVFSVLNMPLLRIRIREEEKALQQPGTTK